MGNILAMVIIAVVALGVLFYEGPNQEPAQQSETVSNVSTTIAGQDIPDIRAFVVDDAGVIGLEQEAVLTEKLTEFAQSGNGEIAVLTVKSLNGLSVEEFGIRVGEKWKVGKAGKDDGVIVIVATEDRKVRIEVGRGAAITDAQAGEVLDGVMVPKLKAGDWAGGISDSVDELIQLVSK